MSKTLSVVENLEVGTYFLGPANGEEVRIVPENEFVSGEQGPHALY